MDYHWSLLRNKDIMIQLSDIRGQGYGDCHIWQLIQSFLKHDDPKMHYIEYECRRCHLVFYHRPEVIPSPFAAMIIAGIDPICKFSTDVT